LDKVKWNTGYEKVRIDEKEIVFDETNNRYCYSGSVSRKEVMELQAGRRFCVVFDNACRHSFIKCIAGWNDYSQPIIPEYQFSTWMDIAKETFPRQWRFLSSLRGVTESDVNYRYKQRQVFSSILSLIRVSNPRLLCHWAFLINTTAYYGWGVKACVVNASTFWGTSVSRGYREDKAFSSLIRNIVEIQKKLLGQEKSVLICFDKVILLGLQNGASDTLSSTTALVMASNGRFTNRVPVRRAIKRRRKR